MKKIIKSYSKRYPILRLFKDDLEQIATLCKENFEGYKIEAGGYELDDISELSKINKREISNFSISAHAPYTSDEGHLIPRPPYISLNISKISIKLYISDKDNIKLSGIFSKIDAILTKRRSFLRILASKWMQIPFLLMHVLTLWFYPDEYKIQKVLLIISIAILAVLWFLWAYNTDKKRHGLIYLLNSHSKISFLKRNRDKIFLIIIGAVVGGVLTFLIELLTKWLIELF